MAVHIQPTLDNEVLDLTEFEFESCCESRWIRPDGPCGQPAEWVLHIIRICCGADLTRLYCDGCLGALKAMPYKKYWCERCDDTETECRPADEIISQLRIKP